VVFDDVDEEKYEQNQEEKNWLWKIKFGRSDKKGRVKKKKKLIERIICGMKELLSRF